MNEVLKFQDFTRKMKISDFIFSFLCLLLISFHLHLICVEASLFNHFVGINKMV